MPNETIDTLQLKVNSDARNASDGLDRLISSLLGVDKAVGRSLSSLGKLSTDMKSLSAASKGLKALKDVDLTGLKIPASVGNLSAMANGLSSLASAAKNFEGVKSTQITATVKALEKISKLDSLKNLQNLGNFSGFSGLMQGFKGFSDVARNLSYLDSKEITSAVSAFRRMSNIDLSKFAMSASSLQGVDFSTFNTLGNALQGFIFAVAEAGKLNTRVSSLVSSIAKLAEFSSNIPQITKALPGLTPVIRDFVNTMSEAAAIDSGVASITASLATLASSGKKAEAAASFLPSITSQVGYFIEALSKAPKLNDNVVKTVQSLAQLASSSGRAGTAANSLRNNITSLSTSFGGLKGNLAKALSGFKSFTRQILSAVGIVGGLYTAFRGIRAAVDISSDLTEVQNVVDVTFGDMKQKVEDLAKTSIGDFGMSELALKQISSRFQAMGVAMGYSQERMSDMSIGLTKLAADMASFYNVEQADVAQDLESVFTGMTRPLRQYGLDLTEATLQEWAMKNGIDANLKSMTQQQKTLLRYQYVMANTTAAQGDFLRTQGTWANQTRILVQNFKQLGKIIGGSFINAFRPMVQALNAVMAKVIEFAETVSNALGKIFGWRIEISGGGAATDFGDMADDLSDAGESAGGVGSGLGDAAKGAKEVKKNLSVLPFDELNQLAKDSEDIGAAGGSGGSGGGGGGAGGLGGAAGEGAQANLVATDTIFDQYKSKINTLYELGDYIGTALTKALDSINWDSVYAGARNFGKGLADFLNGLISPSLFGAVGRTIAGALNTAIYAALSFGITFDWKDFGLSIATGVNEFFRTFDFKSLANSIDAWVKGIWTTLKTAIANIKWGDVLEGIGDFISELDIGTIGIIIGAITIKKILKLKLAKKALDLIGSGISKMLVKAIGEMIGVEFEADATLGTAITTGLGSIVTGTILPAITSLFGTVGGALGLEGAAAIAAGGGIILAAAVAAVAAIVAAVTHWDDIKTFFDETLPNWWQQTAVPWIQSLPQFFLDLPSKIYENILGLKDKFAEWISGLVEWAASAIPNLITSIANFFSQLPEKIEYALGLVIGSIARWKAEMISKVATEIPKIISSIVGYFFNLQTEIWKTLGRIISDLGKWALNMLKTAKSEVPKIIDWIKENWSRLTEILYKVGTDALRGFVNGMISQKLVVLEKVWDFVKGVIAGFKDGFDIHSPSRVLSDIGANVSKGLINGINSQSSSVLNTVRNMTSSITKNVSNAMNSMQRSISSSVGNVSKSFGNVQNMASNAARNIVNAFKNIHIPLPHIKPNWKKYTIGDYWFSLPTFSIQWYKKGGLFDKASMIGVGEAGKEAVLPLENKRTMAMIADSISQSGGLGMDEDTLTNAVARGVAMAMMNNSGNQAPINVYATLYTENDEVLARAVTRGQRSLDYRNNPVPQFG